MENKEKRFGDWIQTYSGGQMWPLDARVNEIQLIDIAHALSNQCRWAGHVKKFYSVAQHSVIVSELLPEEYALAGLMHDASEAYLLDMVRPVKRFLREYVQFEDQLMKVIAQKFLFAYPLVSEVKAIDDQVMCTEADQLLVGGPNPLWEWDWRSRVIPNLKIDPWEPKVARSRFVERFAVLTGVESL